MTDKYQTWGLLLYSILNNTFESEINESETKELAFLERALMGPLNSFGFMFVKIPGSAHDFEIREFGEDGGHVIFGEAKESAMLPRKCIKFGSELCLFDFATRVVKVCSPKTWKWTARYRNLSTLLGMPSTEVNEVDQQASPLVEELLQQEGGIQQVATSVFGKTSTGIIRATRCCKYVGLRDASLSLHRSKSSHDDHGFVCKGVLVHSITDQRGEGAQWR